MPFVIGNGTAQLRIVFRLTTDPEDMVATLGLVASAAFTSGELTAIYDALADNLTPILSEDYEFRGYRVTGKSDAGAPYDEEFFSTATGATVASVLPQNCAVLVQKRTGVPGRPNRGRMYLPGVATEASVAPNGIIESSALAGFQAAMNSLYTDLTDGAATGIADLAVLHPAGTHTVITALVVDDTIATQRRRLR